MSRGDFPVPQNRATDKSRAARASAAWLKYSFLWGPLLVAGILAAIAYPAKVLADLRSENKTTVQALADELRPEIKNLQEDVRVGKEERADQLEILSALLSSDCADTPARERIRRRIAKACEKIGAPSYIP